MAERKKAAQPEDARKADAERRNDASKPGNTMQTGTADPLEPSGAILEPDAAPEADLNHPAVDTEPRAGLPPESSQIDFNDPHFTHTKVRQRPPKEPKKDEEK